MSNPDIWFWTCAIIASLLVGASKGGLPGVGVLGVPVLTQATSPVVAAGLLLPILMTSDVYGVWIYRHKYSLPNIKIVVSASLIGIGLGWATAHVTSDSLVKLLVGLIGLLFFADGLLKRNKEIAATTPDLKKGFFWGSIAGFTSFVAHAGGPPYQMYVLPQKLDKMTYAGTATITFAIINLLKVPPYWMLGQLNLGSLEVCAWLTPVAVFGAFAGYRLTKIIPEKTFFQFVKIALFLLSLKLIWDGLAGLTK
jgi:uncharacterized membrane protein YfcA